MLAKLIKEKELEFTKNVFEPKINNKSRRMAISRLDSIYTNRTKSAEDKSQ